MSVPCQVCEKPATNWAFESRSAKLKYAVCDEHKSEARLGSVVVDEYEASVEEQALRHLLRGPLEYQLSGRVHDVVFDHIIKDILATVFTPERMPIIEAYVRGTNANR